MKIIKYFLALFIIVSFAIKVHAANPGDVVINEIAWMGTSAGSTHEWIELYNNTGSSISLAGWKFTDDANMATLLAGATIAANGFFIIARNANVFSDVREDSIELEALTNGPPGERLRLYDPNWILIDEVDCSGGAWFAGCSDNDITMERIRPDRDGNSRDNWADNNLEIINGLDAATPPNPILGTPRQKNSVSHIVEVDVGDKLMKVSQSPFFPHGDNPGQATKGMISYKVPQHSFLTITIFDINGRLIQYIKRNVLVEIVDAQGFTFWLGTDTFGEMVPVGIYIVHLRAEHRDTGKVETDQATIVVGRKF